MIGGQQNVFIFIGPPGSGKGSISSLCTEKFGWKQLSTGNLCRKHIARQTKIGKEIDFAIKSGKLVSDSLITGMVIDWFMQMGDQDGITILDGFPRTRAQAESFNELLEKQLDHLKLHVIRFGIRDESIIARLCGRYICQNKECQAVYSLLPGSALAPQCENVCDKCGMVIGRRKDDEENAVRERLEIYHRHEKQLLDFYRQIERHIHEIDADKSLHQVFEDFKSVVGLDLV